MKANINSAQLLESWAKDARKVVRTINRHLRRHPEQHVYGRMASGEWARITCAKSQKGEILGHRLVSQGNSWVPINEWEIR